MINLAQLTEADYEKMAQEIQEISDEQSEESLFESIGNALHDSGLTVATGKSVQILMPKAYDETAEGLSLKKSISFVGDTTALPENEAKNEGKKFWQRFKEKLRIAICTDPQIAKLITGQGTLKEYLIVAIPVILGALSLSLNPITLALIAAAIALIVKVGFAAYCEGIETPEI